MADNQKPNDQQTTQQIPTEEIQKEAAEIAEVAETTPTAQTPAQPQAETKVKETVEESKKASKPVSANLEKIVEAVEKLSVLELADLVHALEERFGVSAAAPLAVAAGAASPASGGEAVSEQTTFNVILSSSGANKIAAIKAVRELVPTLGLKEAKDLVEAAPKPILEGVNKTAAEEAKNKLTTAGATVELQ